MAARPSLCIHQRDPHRHKLSSSPLPSTSTSTSSESLESSPRAPVNTSRHESSVALPSNPPLLDWPKELGTLAIKTAPVGGTSSRSSNYRGISRESSGGESDLDEVFKPDGDNYDDNLFTRGRQDVAQVPATSVDDSPLNIFALPIPPQVSTLKSTPNLYPTFGDWLPPQVPTSKRTRYIDETDAMSRVEAGKNALPGGGVNSRVGLGLSLEFRQSAEGEIKIGHDSVGEQFTTSPFTPFQSDHNDSFTFFPSTSFHDSAAEVSHRSTITLHSSGQTLFPSTPPRSRSSTPQTLPRYSFTSAPPITPPSYHSLPLRPLPPPFIPSSAAAIATSEPPEGYPLSDYDTALLARLHDGRIPTLQQLAPQLKVSETLPNTTPIVNTGCTGAMVPQAGDWKCGACTFVVCS
ncbi:hypothetical protein P7C70_g1913, partial [Phenoliferia sp. Uapishka_3]